MTIETDIERAIALVRRECSARELDDVADPFGRGAVYMAKRILAALERIRVQSIDPRTRASGGQKTRRN